MTDNAPISLDTFGNLLKHGFGVGVWCQNCGHYKQIDLKTLPPEKSCINRMYRCTKCNHRNHGNIGPADNPFAEK